MHVTFGGELNYRTERIVFNVAEIPLPYNGILGRPALAKFMAAAHYAYNMLKMSGPLTIISVPSDKKDALMRRPTLPGSSCSSCRQGTCSCH